MAEAADEPLVVDKVISSPRASTGKLFSLAPIRNKVWLSFSGAASPSSFKLDCLFARQKFVNQDISLQLIGLLKDNWIETASALKIPLASQTKRKGR